MTKLIYYIKSNRVISVFNLLLVLICLFPMGYIFVPEDIHVNYMTWRPIYIFEDELIIILMPMLLFTVLFQLLRFNIWRRIVLLALIFVSCIFSLIGGLSGIIPAQDFTPELASVLMVFTAPLAIAIWFIDAREFRRLKEIEE